jgi:glycosyltransferase involved in cell wall biosynthesis
VRGNFRISVVIPSRNRPEALDETLEGLRDQTLRADEYEIVVADDGSIPPVRLRPWVSGPRCNVVRLEGRERSAARNAGARAAEGEILVFLDDDISVGRDFLDVHLAAQMEWPGALVVGAVRLSDEVLRTPFGRFRRALEDVAVPRHRGIVRAKNLCTAQNTSIRRDRFLQLGGFAEGLVIAEDQDLALRHCDKEGIIVFVPEAQAIHRDVFCSARSYCKHMEWGYERMIPFHLEHLTWEENIARDRINGPPRWGEEPVARSARKLVKRAIALGAVSEILFAIVPILEHSVPDSRLLHRVYSLLLGAHIFRGYRKGLESQCQR